MSVHRLTAASLAHPGSYGRCSACDKRLKPGDETVRLYGETFHYDCAFYRQFTAARLHNPPIAVCERKPPG